jgi:hypothetical protein
LPGGGVLREVYRARIVFAREGRMEELSFQQHPLQFAGPPSVGAIAALVAAGSSYSTAGLPAGPMSQAEAEVIAGAALEAQLAAEADAAAEKAARQPGAKPWKLAEREPDSPPEH